MEEGLERRGQLGCVFNMQIEEMGLHHAVPRSLGDISSRTTARIISLRPTYIDIMQIHPSPPPHRSPMYRVLLMSLCFLPPPPLLSLPAPRHERVPTFRFSINWLDYSNHSNQLARYTRLFALVIEIIIGPGDDICIYIYISVVRY